MRSLLARLGTALLAFAYEAAGDPLARFDNTRDTCPACGRFAEPCARDGQWHDACLGHIEGATSACCGHGLGMGHVLIGGAGRGDA